MWQTPRQKGATLKRNRRQHTKRKTMGKDQTTFVISHVNIESFIVLVDELKIGREFELLLDDSTSFFKRSRRNGKLFRLIGYEQKSY